MVTPWENSEDYASVRTRTMKFVKSCDLPELEQAPATKTQKWKACGEVGTVISSSTKLENVPFADIFTVSDCLVVKAVGPSRVSVSASMDVMFSEPSSMETHIFETVSKEVIEWYVAYIAALRSYLQLHAPQSLNSPARNSFHSRFSMGHDDVEDSDDENDQGHDDKGDNAQHGDGSRGPAEIELSQL